MSENVSIARIGLAVVALLLAAPVYAWGRPVLFDPIAEPPRDALQYVVDVDSRERTLPPEVRVLRVESGLR